MDFQRQIHVCDNVIVQHFVSYSLFAFDETEFMLYSCIAAYFLPFSFFYFTIFYV